MSEKLYEVSREWAERAWVDAAKYREMYDASIADPDAFWGEHGKRIDWFRPYTTVKNTTFGPGDVSIRWFEDGTTNVSYNCVDRHLETRGDQVAIIWEGDDPSESKTITYRELHGHVARWANVLRNRNVTKGGPRHPLPAMIPEAAYAHARLRAARRGALDRVRRLLARRARRAHRGLRLEMRDHGRRGPARRSQGAAQDQCRRRHRAPAGGLGRPRGSWCAAPAARFRWIRAGTSDYDAAAEMVTDECPCRGGRRGGFAVHPHTTSGSTGKP